MDPTLLSGLIGGLGGACRAFVGLTKALALKKRVIWSYFFMTVVTAVLIGILCGVIFNFDLRLSAVAGYAGTDLLEGVYKSFKLQKVLLRS